MPSQNKTRFLVLIVVQGAAAWEHMCAHNGLGATATVDCSALTIAAVPSSTNAVNFIAFSTLSGASAGNTHSYKVLNTDADNKIWAINTGGYFVILMQSGGEAALIDCPAGSSLAEDLTLLLSGPLTHIVMSHDHFDHVGDCGAIKTAYPDAKVMGSEYLKLVLTDRSARTDGFGNAPNVPIPEMTYKDGDSITIGLVQFDIKIHDGHDIQDTVYIFNSNSEIGLSGKIVFEVDVIFPGWSPFFNLAMTKDVTGFYDAMELLKNLNGDVYVGGHLTRLGTHADVVKQIAYFADIMAGAQLGLQTVNMNDIGAQSGVFAAGPTQNNMMVWMGEYFAAMVDVCEDYVLDSSSRSSNWKTELGAVEVTLRSHCGRVVDALRIREDFAHAALFPISGAAVSGGTSLAPSAMLPVFGVMLSLAVAWPFFPVGRATPMWS